MLNTKVSKIKTERNAIRSVKQIISAITSTQSRDSDVNSRPHIVQICMKDNHNVTTNSQLNFVTRRYCFVTRRSVASSAEEYLSCVKHSNWQQS